MSAQIIALRSSPLHPSTSWSPRTHAALHRVAASSVVAAMHRPLPFWQGYAAPLLVAAIATATTLCGWSWVVATAVRMS